ncbi:PREDICTED: interleukin-1 receptor-associated kinase 4 isoform X1 [Crocodylus porosus]|uniref:Interleukin-1 receptor-associated kinase 4 n=2 Tax=Crocodylus porosus TaxID=8502 RepID=A0A7M4FWD7_CROPO|nr:PREDICTED: interleukin-1 receptor-associated kinase 4 isoform X1 [Crocodylus porosus]XP_019398899.1 PREDICTED: interleukin-1 receptor-associated kinase 4 isoform X1 [Crocodylus porosus]XP_019398904.1 PREDICTED: interleukin-1 receptor-associated kinase 4 isoform X1 [Crocodylus porosus]XP_019398905.1 PREDICTED: interleukin-1 receptor-associated kinase 4 isoform X1 [Crocodylus porosus]
MSKSVTPSTYVRCIGYGLMRQLADFLDPQEGWKKLAVDIKNPSGENRYNQMHIRRFEGLIQMGKSPTMELLFDWGTSNCTVSELVDILIKNQLLAPATLLLPDDVQVANDITWKMTIPFSSQETMPLCGKQVPVEEKQVTTVKPVLAQDSEQQPSASSCLYQENNSPELSGTDFLGFCFHELESITNNFDERPESAGGNKLGEGGFGVVFKGCINGRTVAVKKLAAMVDVSIQDLKQQFDQEIKTLAKCHHENLVELLGFSSDGDQPCLVYEFMSNGSLLDRLACLDDTAPIPWSTRCKISHGTANGINFLHENNHIHRDVKSANILLNEAFVPKISDFGLARASVKFTQTIMTDRIVGTAAYMAPEALRGEITPKADIFSFGVVLLEIITGLSPVDENREPQLLLSITEEIEDEEKTIEDYVDEKMSDWDTTSINKMYTIASQCLSEKKNRRPDIKMVQQHLQEIIP